MGRATGRPSRWAKVYKTRRYCRAVLFSVHTQLPKAYSASGVGPGAHGAGEAVGPPDSSFGSHLPATGLLAWGSGREAAGAPRRPVRFFPTHLSLCVVCVGRQEARRQARHASGCARNGPGLRDERARLTAPLANSLADDPSSECWTSLRWVQRKLHLSCTVLERTGCRPRSPSEM